MISNTQLFYARAKTYQEKRAAIVAAYEARMKGIERTKGSPYYTDESKKAYNIMNNALKELKSEYWKYFDIALEGMEKANKRRGMKPPTEEELRTLQLLKMKEKPTEEELEAAANTLKGNVSCLSVLTDISRASGYIRSYERYSEDKELSTKTAAEKINQLRACLRDFMDYDTTRAARINADFVERNHGIDNTLELHKRPLFETKAECFYTIAGMSGDMLEAFENAVNDKETA